MDDEDDKKRGRYNLLAALWRRNVTDRQSKQRKTTPSRDLTVRDKRHDAAGKYGVKIPRRIVWLSLAVFLLLPLIVVWRWPSAKSVVPSSSAVPQHLQLRGHNVFPAWMEEAAPVVVEEPETREAEKSPVEPVKETVVMEEEVAKDPATDENLVIERETLPPTERSSTTTPRDPDNPMDAPDR